MAVCSTVKYFRLWTVHYSLSCVYQIWSKTYLTFLFLFFFDLGFVRFFPLRDPFCSLFLFLNNMSRPCFKPFGASKKTWNKHSAVWLLHLQKSTDVYHFPFFFFCSYLKVDVKQTFPCCFPVWILKKKREKEVNLSVLCYLSISIAVTLSGSHDKILMGPFSLVPLVPPFCNTISPARNPLDPIPSLSAGLRVETPGEGELSG